LDIGFKKQSAQLSKNRHMKRISVLLVLTFILLNSLYSQEKNTSKEIGIYFSNLDAFGIRYKFGNEKRMFRLTALSLSVGNYSTKVVNGTNLDLTRAGAGLNVGVQFPVRITDVFSFYYGGELRGSFSHLKANTSPITSNTMNAFNAGIGLVLGFSHSFQSNITVSAEIVPGFSYSKTVNDNNGTSGATNTKTTGFGFALDSNAAGITIGYRF